MVKLKDIESASAKLKGVIHETPLIYSYAMNELTGANVYFKLENLQRTGSFKIRGSYNKLSTLDSSKPVIAASAGNHAQGVALSSKLLGMRAKVVMPEGTAINKMLAVKDFGAEVILHGENFDESLRYAISESEKSGMTFIHPFNDIDIIAGQGTIGLEIASELKDIDAAFIPVGGGGLISGISIALKNLNPGIKIFGVQTEIVPSMVEAISKDKVTEVESGSTIADGIAVKCVGELTLEAVKNYVDEVFTVNEEEIEESLLILVSKKRLVVEGCGAVGLAGFFKKQEEFENKNVVVLVSGGNIDINVLAKVIDRGMLRTGKLMKLEVELPDKPGALGNLATLLGSLKANIIHILHDRISEGLAIDRAIVEIAIETRNPEHQLEISGALKENGYKILKILS